MVVQGRVVSKGQRERLVQLTMIEEKFCHFAQEEVTESGSSGTEVCLRVCTSHLQAH